MDEVRERFATVPGELRGYLTVVPETRWLKHADHRASSSTRRSTTTTSIERTSMRSSRRRPMSLRELLEDAAAELPGVEGHERGAVQYLVSAERPFAALADGRRAEFALDPASRRAAALRTPDVDTLGARGRLGRLRPSELDGHAADRAAAWLASACRRLALDAAPSAGGARRA